MMLHPYEQISLVLQLLMGGIYLAAALPKLGSLDEAIHAVRSYQLLPSRWGRVAGIMLVIMEILLGVGLAAGIFLPYLFAISCLLLIMFSLGTAVNIRRGRKIHCYCFGRSKAPVSWRVIARNLTLFALSLVGAFVSALPKQIEPLDSVLLVLSALALSTSYHTLVHVVDLRTWLANHDN